MHVHLVDAEFGHKGQGQFQQHEQPHFKAVVGKYLEFVF
jgi:hypothetical protein